MRDLEAHVFPGFVVKADHHAAVFIAFEADMGFLGFFLRWFFGG
jgi:hypothetical protein